MDIDFQLFARFSYRKCCADKIPENQRRNSHGANGGTRRRRALRTALEQHSDRKQWKAANCVRRFETVTDYYETISLIAWIVTVFRSKTSYRKSRTRTVFQTTVPASKNTPDRRTIASCRSHKPARIAFSHRVKWVLIIIECSLEAFKCFFPMSYKVDFEPIESNKSQVVSVSKEFFFTWNQICCEIF